MLSLLHRISIGTRLGLGFALVIVFIAALIIPVVVSEFSATIDQAELRELRALHETAMAEIGSEQRLAEAMSRLMASLPPVKRAMAERDRQSLVELTDGVFDPLRREYGVRQFHFHVPPATSFYRVHKPEKHGDDLSGFRKTVLAANRQRSAIRGLEKGVAGLGLRGMAPIEYRGDHQGTVEFGMSFGQPFFDKFKEEFGVDIGLYLHRSGGFEPFASTLSDPGVIDDPLLRRALEGKTAFEKHRYADRPVISYGRAVEDFSGEPVGVMVVTMDRSAYVAQMNQTRNKVLLIMAVAVAIAAIIAILISRSIITPIRHTMRAMEDIASGEGDLTRRLETSGNDEITELSQAFNQFAEKMRQSIEQVSGSTVQLSSAAEELSQITADTNEGVQRQQQETEQVATAMNEMTATVQEIARNAASAATAAQEADGEARDGEGVVDETIERIGKLVDEVEHAAQVIGELERSSEQISTVVDVIREISEQTNLLALNAAIEAARAGESGRGFSVVASEIRSLANRTQESTQEIQGMIESVQGGSREAVGAMNSSREHARTTADQAHVAGDSLKSITRAIGTITDMNTQIASAAEEQGQVAEEINRNVVNINEAAAHSSEGGKQTATASSELARLASRLQELVDQFHT